MLAPDAGAADYQALRLSRDSNGQYFGGGFFSDLFGGFRAGGGAVSQKVTGPSLIEATCISAPKTPHAMTAAMPPAPARCRLRCTW